jgi:DhnA family fructose-bisphosphate aldolase class Ia
MDSKMYRLREFIRPSDGHSLVVDTSAGLSLGALPGLERFSQAVDPLLSNLDGVVTSPGLSRRLAGRTRQQAALLVRAEWTNALRPPDFVLHPETTSLVPLLEPRDALDLGGSALVFSFLLGYDEQIEADCLRHTVQLALQGNQAGIPLVSELRPTGPRVVLMAKAIELGVSYALESGADGIALPWPGPSSFQTILTMAAGTPLWIKLTDFPVSEAAEEALGSGATGLWLDEGVFAQPEPLAVVQALYASVHGLSYPQASGKEAG